MTKTKAILFDVDGVLLDSATANIDFYQELFRQGGLTVPSRDQLGAQNHLSIQDMIHCTYPGLPVEEVQRLKQLAETIDAGIESLQVMPGAVDVVTRLSANYKLGIVTNRTRSGVEELWQVSSLREYFAGVAAFEDTARHKPDAEPVRYVLNRLGVQPAEAVFIGDAMTDWLASQAAGVRYIMFGLGEAPANVPTATNFHQLLALIPTLP